MRPPRLAEWLLECSLPDDADERDAVLGDLAEEHDAIAAAEGARLARRWYWRQAARSVLPNIGRRVARRGHLRPHEHRRGEMESIVQDLRYSLRIARRRPGVTGVALASLVVGISLAAVVFSLLNAVLLRPLPVADPDGLAVVLERRTESVNHNFSHPDFTDYRRGQRAFTDLAAFSREEVTIGHAGGSRVVAAELVSGAYFPVLGVQMRYGRTLADTDDRPAAAPAIAISETLWRELYGDEPFAPRVLAVNRHPFEVAGVVARPFRGMEVGRDVHVWVPMHARALIEPGGAAVLSRRTTSWLTVLGRMRDDVTMARAASDINAVEAGVAESLGRKPRALFLASGRQGDSQLPATAGGPLKLLLAAALVVLLIASANAANLMVARATERSREIAVRSALGAGRGRLARLALVETVMLGVAASTLALLASYWLAQLAAPQIARFGEPVTLDLSLDWRMVLFVAACGMSAALIAGSALVLRAFRMSPATSLSEGGRSASSGPGGAGLRRGLVVVQFALALALVVAAGLLARTVHNLRTLPTGLDVDHVVLFGVEPGTAQIVGAAATGYIDAAIDRLASVPGVRAAGFGRVIPLGFGGSRTSIEVPGYTPEPGEDMEINFNIVSPSYFDATGIALAAGRSFEPGDTGTAPPAVIVNETMAARYWPHGTAVGRRVRFGPQSPYMEVVGVARDVKYRMLKEPPAPSFYAPLAQIGARGGVIHVRTFADPRPLIDTLRKALADVNPAVPITTVRTLADQAALNVNDERLSMFIGLALGGAALLLAAVGLYASMAYAVGQRTRELGVRIALGATARDIRRLVLGDSLVLTLLGAGFGAGLALAFARSLESRLFGVGAADSLTLFASAAILAAVALVASWVPARRASRVDPVETLRAE
jgi:predicted permease